MQRVLVMGCCGSGKTTFARALAAKFDLPLISLDRLFWQPGWRESDPGDFSRKVTHETAQTAWVMDGNYIRHGAGAMRRERADTVLWFDLPRHVCVAGILRRIVTSYGKVRPEMAPGCPERFDPAFLHYVWTYGKFQRPDLLEYFKGLRPDQRFVTFSTRAQASVFLSGVGNS